MHPLWNPDGLLNGEPDAAARLPQKTSDHVNTLAAITRQGQRRRFDIMLSIRSRSRHDLHREPQPGCRRLPPGHGDAQTTTA
jgi:hypothetical protein